MERDIKETRDVLLQWAGSLQAIFTIYQLQVRYHGGGLVHFTWSVLT